MRRTLFALAALLAGVVGVTLAGEMTFFRGGSERVCDFFVKANGDARQTNR